MQRQDRLARERSTGFVLSLSQVDPLRDVGAAEGLLAVQAIVRPAAHAKVVGDGLPAARERHDVIELEERAAAAAPALRIDVGALLAIALEHRAPDLSRDVSARLLGSGWRRLLRDGSLLGRARPRDLPEPLLFQLREEQIERAVDDHLEVSARVAVAHEVFDAFELLLRFPRDRQLDAVARRRERLDPRTRLGRSRLRRLGGRRRDRKQRLRRESFDARRDVRLRRSGREHLLHGAHGLARGGAEQVLVVLRREVIAQEAERAEMHLAAFEVPEDARERADEPCGDEPAMRLPLGHAEAMHAEVEHRRARQLEMKPPLFDLGQIGDEPCLPDVTVADVCLELREQLVVREIPHLVHSSFLHPRISTPADAPRRTIGSAIASNDLARPIAAQTSAQAPHDAVVGASPVYGAKLLARRVKRETKPALPMKHRKPRATVKAMHDHEQAFAIVRLDRYLLELAELRNCVTIKRIVWSMEAAEADVARLNQLNAEKGSEYFWQATRVAIRDASSGAAR